MINPDLNTDPAHEALEESIVDVIELPAMSERQHALAAFSHGLQQWLLTLDLSAPKNEINIEAIYRKATPERPFPVVLVYFSHSTKLMGSYKVTVKAVAHAA